MNNNFQFYGFCAPCPALVRPHDEHQIVASLPGHVLAWHIAQVKDYITHKERSIIVQVLRNFFAGSKQHVWVTGIQGNQCNHLDHILAEW